MSTPSRDSFDNSKHYRSVQFVDGRYVPDFSLNEMQEIQDAERENLGDSLYNPSAILNGLVVTLPGSGQITLNDGTVWIYGRAENVVGVTLAYDPAKVIGEDIIFVKWMMDLVTASEDTTLIHTQTGEVIDERLRSRATLATATPDIFDEVFEEWQESVPLNWTRVSGGSAIGYPSRFGKQSLEIRHTTGTETRIERDITLPVSTSLSVYFWVKTQEGYSNLSTLHGAYVDFERSSPAWFPTDIIFSTDTTWVRKSATVVSDANTQSIKIRIVIPSTAPTTRILLDALLVTTSALAANDLDRHYVPIYWWDRATDIVTRTVVRSSRLPLNQLVPPLSGSDITGIEDNAGLQDLLARRTFHENGHFRLPPGLRARRDTLRDTSTKLGMLVVPGWAYVGGRECRVSDSQELLVNKALSFAAVLGENDAFAFGTNYYGLNKAEGADLLPIKEITQLQITYERVVSVTKGSDGSIDDTGVAAVSSIQGVSAGTAGTLTGTTTSFTFTETANELILSVSLYAGGAVGSAQSLKFSFGAYTIAQVLEALNHGSGVAYRSGKIVGNVSFENDGSGHVRIKTKTLSNTSTVTLGSGSGNTILGLTNGATNTGTGTHYAETTSWVRSGNGVDWVGAAPQPSNGNSYSVVVRNTETVVLNTDYRLGGAFVASASYQYKTTAIVGGTEGQASAASNTLVTEIGGVNRVAWNSIGSAQSYGVYRSDNGSAFRLLKYVDATPLTFLDDGSITPNASINPPGSGAAGPSATSVQAYSTGIVNTNPVGKMPVDGSNITTDYTYYQPYMAYLVINQRALVFVIEGEPSDRPSPPSVPPGVMELTQLEMRANSTSILIQDIKKYDRVPQADIRTLTDRVNSLETTSLGQLVLNDVAKRGDGSTHKGRVAEGFSDEIGSDFSYNSGGVVSNIGLYPTLQFAGMPQTYTQPSLVVNSGNTTAIHQEEDYILPSTEEVLVAQDMRSDYLQINPYAGVRVAPRTIELFPNSSEWAFRMNTAVTPQQRTARTATLLAALWRKTVGRVLPPWNADAETIQQSAQQALRKGLESSYQFETEPVVVTVEGRGFRTHSGTADVNLRGFFGGIAVDLTAVSPTAQGTPFGGKTTINADTMGRWKARFTVPAGISAGSDDLFVTNGTVGSRATFTSLTVGNVVPEPPLREVGLYDPIAQSIGPWPVDKTLSAIGLFFVDLTGIPDLSSPIYMQIRTIDNGFPTRIALATKVIDPADITWNAPVSGIDWIMTVIPLDRYLAIPRNTQVAVTLITSSLRHRVAIATRGRKNQFGRTITSNLYGPGVLFVSSNGVTWESLQNSDMSIFAYGRSFSTSAVLEFNSVAPSAVSRLWLAADQQAPEGSTIKWEYVLNGGSTLPISPFTKTRPPAVPTGVVLRARLSCASSGVTPRIALPTLALVGEQRGTAGTWVSTAKTFTQSSTNALMIATVFIPAGTSLAFYISRDDGAAWTAMGAPTDIIDLDVYWKEYQWNTPVALGGSSSTKKIRVRIEATQTTHLNYGPTFGRIGVALT